MADNAIMTQEFAETVLFHVKEQLPILEGTRINKKLSERLEEGSGSTVNVLVPGVNELVKGSAVDPNSNIRVDKVGVVVEQYNISAPFSLKDDTLNLYTFKTQVSKPNAMKMASRINTDIFRTVCFGAANSAIVTNLQDLAIAIATVDSSRVGSTKSAMLNPTAIAKLIGANGGGAFGWQANDRKGFDLYEGVIGEYFGCDCFKSPDAGIITGRAGMTGTITGGLVDGSKALTVDGLGTGLIPAGTPFKVQGVAATDVYGNDIGDRTFVTTADVVATGTGDVLPVGTINMVGGAFAIPNTVGSGTAIACPLNNGQRYAIGGIFAENAGAFASIQPAKFHGTTDSVATRIAGELNVLSSIISNGETGMQRWRFDVLYGVSSLYNAGANMIYIPL